MSRAKRVVERIKAEVPLIELLGDYGYQIDVRVGDREQQFSCDLHGDGSDSTPSARYYPGTGQFFCFACGKSRDAIALVREKEGATFWQAVKKIEARFGLQSLPWEADDDREETIATQIEAKLKPEEDLGAAFKRAHRFLLNITQERALAPERCAALWEIYDLIERRAKTEPDNQGAFLARLLDKAKKMLNPEEERGLS